jgi:CysZ protein
LKVITSQTNSGFLIGVRAPLKGLELIIKKPKIRHAAIIPFMVVMVIFFLGAILGIPFLFQLVPAIAKQALLLMDIAQTTVLASILYWGLILISLPVALFGLLFALFLCSQLLAAPFYALLAEKVLVETGLRVEEPFRVGEWLRSNSHLAVVALIKVTLFAFLGIVLFVLSFIPGVGVFSAAGLLLMTTFDIADVSFEALKMGLRERLHFFRDEFPAFVGLATSLALIFLIPGLNFFLFPAAIAGVSEILLFVRSRNQPADRLIDRSLL